MRRAWRVSSKGFSRLRGKLLPERPGGELLPDRPRVNGSMTVMKSHGCGTYVGRGKSMPKLGLDGNMSCVGPVHKAVSAVLRTLTGFRSLVNERYNTLCPTRSSAIGPLGFPASAVLPSADQGSV